MNVLFVLAGDRQRASVRYRVLNYIPFLSDDIEYSVVSAGSISNVYDKIAFGTNLIYKSISFDVIFIQKILLPRKFTHLLSMINKNIIYDFDDAIHRSPPWNSKKSSENTNLKALLSRSEYIVAGSTSLSEYAKKYNKSVVTIPTPVQKNSLNHNKYKGVKNKNEDTILIGWIGNPENVWYLKQRSNEIQTVLDTNQNAELHIITSIEPEKLPLYNRSDVVYWEWSEKKQPSYLSAIDIGIRPLTDDPWTRSKGGFTSVVQMMAYKIPMIVTPVGDLKDYINHKQSGYHATNGQDWINFLNFLVQSPEQRNQIGENARNRIGELNMWTEDSAAMFERILYKSYSE